jgi:hypothetical protein
MTVDSSAICPECSAGKHGNCDGTALDIETDEIVDCDCKHVDHQATT